MISNHSYPSDKCTFELLSAYLDGEVTSEQRKQVELLLDQDIEVQALYNRLLILREEIYNLPTPVSEYSSTDLSNAVFAKIDQQKKIRQFWLWGTGAIAAMLVATFGGIINEKTPIWQIAQENQPPTGDQETLIIALNEPVIEIPPAQSENLAIPLDNSLLETIKHENQKP